MRSGISTPEKAGDRPTVQFDTTVSGVEIPLRIDYPESARKRMWASFAEIHTNAERNINEFRADGYSWQNACEEDGMMLQSVGVLVHPASYKRPKVHKKLSKKKRRRKVLRYPK